MRLTKVAVMETVIRLDPEETQTLKQVFEHVGYAVYPPELDDLAAFLGVGG